MANDSPQLNPHIWVKPEYQESDGVRFEGRSVEELVGKVVAYRKSRQQQYGNVFREVVDQICNRRPDACRWPAAAPRPQHHPRVASELNKRILDWITNAAERYVQGRIRYVKSRKEAQRRFELCKNCPRQKGWAHTCDICRLEVTRLGDTLRSPTKSLGIRVNESEGLMGCSTLGEDTRVSIYLSEPSVDSNVLPGNCWRKR